MDSIPEDRYCPNQRLAADRIFRHTERVFAGDIVFHTYQTPMAAPIILFVYNRPAHTREALHSLLRNPLAAESSLFVYSDGAADDGVTNVVNRFGRVIVLEDDLVVPPTSWIS